MPTLYTLCGLPGSGKSTFANSKSNCVVVSSDAIRKELYGNEEIQGNPKEIFKIMDERTKWNLENGNDVIYDATNVSKRTRISIIKKFQANHICVFFNIPVKECLKRNQMRSRKVPTHVIERMASNLTTPTLDEGFSEIIVINP